VAAPNFTERLATAIADCRVRDPKMRSLIGRAIADTLAVAAAGFPEHVARALATTYAGQGPAAWSGERMESREAAILLNGAASHALDFDDVYLDSSIHSSTVILPAIFVGDGSDDPDDLIDAFGAGLLTARAVAERLGVGHYRKGWHGTGTIGAFAATGAAARLHKLDPEHIAWALALISAQAGGVQLNFGTWAKPSHAGFAAANGYRAVRMAQAGIDGARDIFGKKGFADLYGTGDGIAEPSEDVFQVRADRVSVKLFPCCYATHRLIGAALDARKKLGSTLFRQPDTRMILRVPARSIEVLIYPYPRRGNEGKFSPRFPVAAALADGPPTLAHFSDVVVQRPDIVDIGHRLDIVEDQSQPSGGAIDFGTVALEVSSGGKTVGTFERQHIPGDPNDPPASEALAAKFESCFEAYETTFAKLPPVIEPCGSMPEIWNWLRLGFETKAAAE
jgi:2-methylcitrate dehydratase PrpD